MEKKVCLNCEEAREVLDTMDNAYGEFAGCYPSDGDCKNGFDPGPVACRICKKIRLFLAHIKEEE